MAFDDDYSQGIITGTGSGSQHLEIGVAGSANASRIYFYDGVNPTPSVVGLNPNYSPAAMELSGTQQRGVSIKSSDSTSPGASMHLEDDLTSCIVIVDSNNGIYDTSITMLTQALTATMELQASDGTNESAIDITPTGIAVGSWATDHTARNLARGPNTTHGLIIQGDIVTLLTDASGNVLITFTTAFPNALLSAVVEPGAAGGTVGHYITAVSASQVGIHFYNTVTGAPTVGVNLGIAWIAVGY